VFSFSAGVVDARSMVGARLVDAHVFGAGAGVMANNARADARVLGVQVSGARAGGARPEYCSRT